MIVLGLTGSIAMGKSTASALFRREGVPVFCADQTVHGLLGPGGAAVTAIEAAFPGVVAAGAVDRAQLAAKVFADPQALKRLEAIVHPLVIDAQERFLKATARRDSPLAVLDIPLLFEAGLDRLCDRIAVVSAPASVQYQRLVRRRTLDAVRIKATLARQMPDALKRRRADFIIPSGQGRALTRRVIVDIIRTLKDNSRATRTRARRPRHAGRRSLTKGPSLR
ncbi:Dephospho-CoA kinase [uncultured Defluviicoccus sp.]|uniref:Dephospho-CoA kinase n=1 Tax=metagenome TaxID=256318 RepID=A0A380TKP6_9ZZZZ|nr:Dephospho-CoA kinase [uncultured Defluviicoccus sp.]